MMTSLSHGIAMLFVVGCTSVSSPERAGQSTPPRQSLHVEEAPATAEASTDESNLQPAVIEELPPEQNPLRPETATRRLPGVEELPPEQNPLRTQSTTHSANNVELGSGPTRVQLQKQPVATRLDRLETAFAVAAPLAMPSKATVVLRDVHADDHPDAVFHVYLGGRDQQNHLGVFSYYDAVRHPRTFRLDASAVAQRLATNNGPWVVYVVAIPTTANTQTPLSGNPRVGTVELVTR
jgi:hypothetical protein